MSNSMPSDAWPTLRLEQLTVVEAVLPLMPVPFTLKDLTVCFPTAPTGELEAALQALENFERVGRVEGGYYWRAM